MKWPQSQPIAASATKRRNTKNVAYGHLKQRRRVAAAGCTNARHKLNEADSANKVQKDDRVPADEKGLLPCYWQHQSCSYTQGA